MTGTAPMTAFSAHCEVRWADLDVNGHARHTAFMDWATHARTAAFSAVGIGIEGYQQVGVGPIIFREETDYLREVGSMDTVTVTFEFTGRSADWKHFRIRHRLTRRDGVHCANVVVRGAWFDLRERRVVAPPAFIASGCARLPRAVDFQLIEPGSR